MWLRLSGETVNDDLQFSYDYDNDVWLDAIDSVGDDDSYLMRYDANGNPVDVSDMHFHWTNGRMLDSITYTDDRGVEQPLASYTYDDNGIRTSKTFGDTTTYYTNVDGAITSQYCLDEDGAVTDLMQFLYDGSNELLGFTYNGATYFYVKNLQGDVIAVIDSTGTEKAVYEYGAYGTLIYSGGDLADVNPMRYRGYYYDSDFGGYYLQSRYYAPEFAKFINSDLPEYAQVQKNYNYGTNLFAYCCNDPVNNSDKIGYSSSLVGSAFFYYFVNYLLPNAIVHGILFVSGVLLVYLLIKIVTEALNSNSSSSSSSNSPKKPDDDPKVKKILKKIPNSLKKDGKVDLTKFDKKVKGETAWKSSNGWKISKDTAKHGGRVWKLFDKSGKRIASLGADGSVLAG